MGDLTPVWVPDAAHEALRDLVRARLAAKRDQLRARHRLAKFLLRHGRRAPQGVRAWTMKYLDWVRGKVHFEQPAQEATLLDYLHEVEHAAARIQRLEQAIDAAIETVPATMGAVICAVATANSSRQANPSRRSSQPSAASCWASSGRDRCRGGTDCQSQAAAPRRLSYRGEYP